MVQGIYERKCRCAIQRPSVIQGSRNANRCFIDIGNAEVDFSHCRRRWLRKGRLGGYGKLVIVLRLSNIASVDGPLMQVPTSRNRIRQQKGTVLE